MARDDYHVIVYQILSYLYNCLKNGKRIDAQKISHENEYFVINEAYWAFIMENLYRDGLIRDVIIKETKGSRGSEVHIVSFENCKITPKGIEYLTDNSFMKKAKEFFKDVKSIVPFI